MRSLSLVLLCVSSALAKNADIIRYNTAQDPCHPEDPMLAPSGNLSANFDPVFSIEGLFRDLIIHGLSKLLTTVDFNLLLMRLNMEIKSNHVTHITCDDFRAAGFLDFFPMQCIPSGTFEGKGSCEIQVSHLHINVTALLNVIIITNRVHIRDLKLNTINIGHVTMNCGDVTVNGEAINWEELLDYFNKNFHQELAEHHTAMTAKFKDAAEGFVSQFTLTELIDKLPTPCQLTP